VPSEEPDWQLDSPKASRKMHSEVSSGFFINLFSLKMMYNTLQVEGKAAHQKYITQL
jgi:hypothetical protein